MVRFLSLAFAVLLTAQAPAFAQITSINVNGQLAWGYTVSVVCSVSNTGQITGSGVLGSGSSNYTFTISKASTVSGKLVLTGNMAIVGYPVTIYASVPNGPLTFAYMVNGKTYSMNGVGVVTAQ